MRRLWNMRRFFPPIGLACLVVAFLPPRVFLDPVALTHDPHTGEFTLVREAASVAPWLADCGAEPERCREIDEAWPVVFAQYRSEAIFTEPPHRECNSPLDGRWSGLEHYQWEPADTVRFPDPNLEPCFNDHPTRVTVQYRVWLFGVMPLIWPVTAEFVFAPHGQASAAL